MTRLELWWGRLLLTLRRAPSHPEAVRRTLFLLFVPVLLTGYWFYLHAQGPELGDAHFINCMFLVMLACAFLPVLANRGRRAKTAFLGVSGRQRSDVKQQPLTAHRRLMSQELLRVAALVDRAGTEAALRLNGEGAVAPGAARRRSLHAVREPEIWGGLTADERELLICADGSWEEQSSFWMLGRSEDVRVLRWVLGIDAVLRPLDMPAAEIMSAIELTSNPSLVEGSHCMQPWDMRPAQDAAQTLLAHCVNEGVRRGLYEVDSTEHFVDASFYASRVETDYLSGTTTLAAASDEEIQARAFTALRRARTLEQVIAFLYRDDSPTFRIEQEREPEDLSKRLVTQAT